MKRSQPRRCQLHLPWTHRQLRKARGPLCRLLKMTKPVHFELRRLRQTHQIQAHKSSEALSKCTALPKSWILETRQNFKRTTMAQIKPQSILETAWKIASKSRRRNGQLSLSIRRRHPSGLAMDGPVIENRPQQLLILHSTIDAHWT